MNANTALDGHTTVIKMAERGGVPLKSLKAFRLQTHFCIHLKCQQIPAQKPQTWSNDEWFAVKERDPMTNVHVDWSDFRYLRSPNLGIAFSSRKSTM